MENNRNERVGTDMKILFLALTVTTTFSETDPHSQCFNLKNEEKK